MYSIPPDHTDLYTMSFWGRTLPPLPHRPRGYQDVHPGETSNYAYNNNYNNYNQNSSSSSGSNDTVAFYPRPHGTYNNYSTLAVAAAHPTIPPTSQSFPFLAAPAVVPAEAPVPGYFGASPSDTTSIFSSPMPSHATPATSVYGGSPSPAIMSASPGTKAKTAAPPSTEMAETRSVWQIAALDPSAAPSARGERFPRKANSQVHWLLHLPPRAWEGILENLIDRVDTGRESASGERIVNYKEVLALSQLNTSFARVRLERFLPWDVRYAVVRQIDVSPRHGGRHGCYFCFTVKEPSCFQSTGKDPQRNPQLLEAMVEQKNPFTGSRTFIRDPDDPRYHSVMPLPPPPAPRRRSAQDLSRRGSKLLARREGPAWKPNPPGGSVGEVESLGRYCITCAIETGLTIPGDIIHTANGLKRWICRCGKDRAESSQRCNDCGTSEVYRN